MSIIRKASVVVIVLFIICLVLLMLGIKHDESTEVVEETTSDSQSSNHVEIHESVENFKDKDEETLVVSESNPIVDQTSKSFYNDAQYAEYPVACQVWQRLREYGFNEYVSAGILGNMMTECGGHTLALDHDIYSSGGRYYGLCQWSLKYTPQVNGLDVDGQMDVLFSSIETNITYFKGDYHYFCNLTDARQAAIYFQEYYERGAGRESRSNNATTAFNYFVTSEA